MGIGFINHINDFQMTFRYVVKLCISPRDILSFISTVPRRMKHPLKLMRFDFQMFEAILSLSWRKWTVQKPSYHFFKNNFHPAVFVILSSFNKETPVKRNDTHIFLILFSHIHKEEIFCLPFFNGFIRFAMWWTRVDNFGKMYVCV